MKLRTTHNSIRIRIRKSELALLKLNGMIEESITFPNGLVLKFSLKVDKHSETLFAKMEENNIQMLIPTQAATEWINTNKVGIEHHINLPEDKKLHLLLEKDFPCLDRPEEDRSDTFVELSLDKPETC